MEFALRLSDVTRRFGSRVGVEGISLTVAPGELVGLVGPDGSGKTTLARLAAGVIAPTSGTVEPESRGRVGYLTGRFSLYPELTVLENLRFFARLHGMKGAEIEREAERLLGWVGLLPFTGRRAGALSGGMRQKLALVCAVIHRPPLLILDEPTTAVDPVARVEFWRLLKEKARQGCAVLVTTPYMDEAEHCDRVVLLHEGRAVAGGRVSELKQRLPYRMAELTPAGGQRPSRTALAEVAAGLPGCRWTVPLGEGVRIALERSAPLDPPAGCELREVPAALEDVFLWLTGAGAEEVPAR